jgi:hypothetical protein
LDYTISPRKTVLKAQPSTNEPSLFSNNYFYRDLRGRDRGKKPGAGSKLTFAQEATKVISQPGGVQPTPLVIGIESVNVAPQTGESVEPQEGKEIVSPSKLYDEAQRKFNIDTSRKQKFDDPTAAEKAIKTLAKENLKKRKRPLTSKRRKRGQRMRAQ